MLRYGKKLDRNLFLDRVSDLCEQYGITRIVSTTPFYGTIGSAGSWYTTGSLDSTVRLMYEVRKLEGVKDYFTCLRNHFEDKDLDVIYEAGQFYESTSGEYHSAGAPTKDGETVRKYWVERLYNSDWKEPEDFLEGLGEICQRWRIRKIWSSTPFYKTADSVGSLYIDSDSYCAAVNISSWVGKYQGAGEFCSCVPKSWLKDDKSLSLIYVDGIFFESVNGSYDKYDARKYENCKELVSGAVTKEFRECANKLLSIIEYKTGIQVEDKPDSLAIGALENKF